MYAIYTFGPEIMTAFGLGEGHEAILGESVVSLFFLIGSIPAMFWLNSRWAAVRCSSARSPSWRWASSSWACSRTPPST